MKPVEISYNGYTIIQEYSATGLPGIVRIKGVDGTFGTVGDAKKWIDEQKQEIVIEPAPESTIQEQSKPVPPLRRMRR